MALDFSNVERIVQSLKSSPLFNFSLASKELFHSDVLKWLCDNYPAAAGSIFARFVKAPPRRLGELRARREYRNFDLLLEYQVGAKLLVENKVKSIPSEEQLKEYAEKLRNQADVSFLLLSLIPPPFRPPVEWQYLSDREYANDLENVLPTFASASRYHTELLRDYIAFIRNLADLRSCFDLDWNDKQTDFFLPRPIAELLKSIRIFDLIDKARYSQLAKKVGDLLRPGRSRVDFGKLTKQTLKTVRPGDIWLDAGMTRGTGLCDMKYFLASGDGFGPAIALGVQLQGNDFRLVVETFSKDVRADEYADALFEPRIGEKIWFDFSLLKSGGKEYPNARHGRYKRFGATFVCRSKNLRDVSAESLTARIVDYAKLISDNHMALLEQIRERQ